MANRSHLSVAIWSLFLVLFIDGMGQGILFPILTHSLIDIHSTTLVTTGSQTVRNVLYGLVIGSFFVGWFFGGAILSDMSDTIGRKKALIICVAGSGIGYLLCALSFHFHSIALLLIGRILDGFTAGDQPIAQAAVIDLAPKEKRNVYIGYVLFALTVGLVLGPVLGGFGSDNRLLPWFTDATPMYFGVLLSFVALVSLWVFFADTGFVKRATPIHFMRAVDVFLSAFKHRSVRYLLVCYTLMHFGWSMYFLYIAVVLAKVFGFTSTQVSLYMALLAVGLGIGLTLLPRWVGRWHEQRYVVATGYFIVSLASFISAFIIPTALLWIIAIPGVAAFACGYTSLMPIFADQVGSDRQGWVMGLTGSVVALTAALAVVLSALLSAYGTQVPLFVGFAITAIGCFLMLFFQSKQPVDA